MSVRVLFRVAAGPRIGFGHLVRSGTLASAMGTRPVVSLRGSRSSARAASRLGFRVIGGGLRSALRDARPSLLVVDDPSRASAARAVRLARRHGVPTASIHDLGIAPCHSDLSVDGSIAPGPMDLAGPRFAVLHPALRRLAAGRWSEGANRANVVVAFGGGSRRQLIDKVVTAIARRRPDVRIHVAHGFAFRASARDARQRIVEIEPTAFRRVLARATVAVVAGGVTMYEACALGVPVVGVSIAPGQRRSVAGLARRGAVVDGGVVRSLPRAAVRAARLVDTLLDAPGRRRRMARRARRLVDGQGARRVASALRKVAEVSVARP